MAKPSFWRIKPPIQRGVIVRSYSSPYFAETTGDAFDAQPCIDNILFLHATNDFQELGFGVLSAVGDLKRICKKAGIRQATLHSLRHSFGAHLRMAGINLADIADLMGHKDLATTQIYARVQQEHLRTVIEKLTLLVPTDVSLKRVTHDPDEKSDDPKLLTEGGLENQGEELAGC